METRIAKKVELHISSLKADIKEWFATYKCSIIGDADTSDFLQFIYDYNAVTLSKEDFSRRKRIKNVVPANFRCCAKSAGGHQCTRRKKENEEYCGTHIKGAPYGISNVTNTEVIPINKKNIWPQEINGIEYYIDSDYSIDSDSNKYYNIYLHEDILSNKHNPSIIGKCRKDTSGKFYINDKFY